jgi:putative transposase
MIEHWRVKRNKDLWLSQFGAMRINDALSGKTILHAHSKDAAQEGFYKACKTTKALKQAGIDAKYPHHRKMFRTTCWKKSGIKIKDRKLCLARARGLEPIVIEVPEYLLGFEFDEVRLAYNATSCRYDWHVVYDDKIEIPKPLGNEVIAVDLGEIHPAAACSKTEAVVFSARELRSIVQGNNKMRAEISEKQSHKTKYSRRWRKLQQSKAKKLGKFKLVQRDICHKVSRAVVDFAEEQRASTIVIGDVREVADKVSLGKKTNQKLTQWPHGIIRNYIEYKSKQKGMETKLQDEAYTSQTCPSCGNRKKPKGRVYECGKCGWIGSRDGQVGAPNILSLYIHGELGGVLIPEIKYRHPYLIGAMGKRSHADTMQVACSIELQEAVGF